MTAESNGLSVFPEIYDRIRATVKASKPFVAGPRILTYGEVFDRVDRLTTVFRGQGLARDDRAVIVSSDDLAVITLFMALIRNGITAVILNPDGTRDELQALTKAADVKAVFADTEIIERAALDLVVDEEAALLEIRKEADKPKKGLLGRLSGGRVDTTADSYPGILESVTPAKDLPKDLPEATVAYILFTSGTTSRPKGVEITHLNLFAQMATFVRQYGYDPECRLLNVLPLHHTDGLTQGPVVLFTIGASVHRPMRFRVDALPELLDSIYAQRITHLITVPSVLALILNLAEGKEDWFDGEDLRFVISTAAFLDETLWRDFEARFETLVVNVYGLTETVCEALYCGPDEATRRTGTVGKPIDCEARVLDENGQGVASGEVGELVLKGNNVMKGYFRMPEETAAVLKDGWFFTGDLARFDEDGFCTIVGRKKNVIITGGINIYPEDVTSVLRSLPKVLDAVTLGMEDPIWGERVVSCVVPKPGETVKVQEIAREFLDQASREKLPAEIHLFDELPRGPAGKVILEDVRNQVLERRQVSPGQGPARDLQERLLKTAAEVFKVSAEELSLASNPENTKGWSSLAHVELLLTLEKEFGFRMSPQAIMTIKSLSDALAVVEKELAA